jgi:hypothetical protein
MLLNRGRIRTSQQARNGGVAVLADPPGARTHRYGTQGARRCSGSVVVVTRQWGSGFLRVLPSLVEDLLDVVGRSYDGVDYVVLDGVHETILDPGKSDHSLAAVGVVAQTPCDVAANLCLHTGLAKVDIAVAVQLKAHHVLHDPMKPLR